MKPTKKNGDELAALMEYAKQHVNKKVCRLCQVASLEILRALKQARQSGVPTRVAVGWLSERHKIEISRTALLGHHYRESCKKRVEASN